MTSHQEGASQCAPFNKLSYESHVLKEASELRIFDNMIFDPHPTLDLSLIHSGSQDDWSCESKFTDDYNLRNWADNSGFLDETFSSLLSSISKAQTSLDINCIHLKCNSPNPASSIESSLPNLLLIFKAHQRHSTWISELQNLATSTTKKSTQSLLWNLSNKITISYEF